LENTKFIAQQRRTCFIILLLGSFPHAAEAALQMGHDFNKRQKTHGQN